MLYATNITISADDFYQQYGIRFENNPQAEKFIFQMAEEVARRLDSIDSRGRSLTIKIMKRDADAPLEAPKVSIDHRIATHIAKVSLVVHGTRCV